MYKFIKNFNFFIFVTLFLNNSFAQYKPSNGILVYFKEGVYRTAPGEESVNIGSEKIQNLFKKFNMDLKNIESAFPDFNEADTLKTLESGISVKLTDWAKIFKIYVPNVNSREVLIDSLVKYDIVLFAEPDGLADVDLIPSDNHFGSQWNLHNTAQSGGKADADIDSPEAWDIFTGSSSIKIGIIDKGVDRNHEDLSGKVTGSTTLYSSHGTHVAGIAAAKANNQVSGQYFGIAGVDWNAQIIAKAFNDGYSSGYAYISQIIGEAVSAGSHVLNNSWKLLPIGRYSTTVRLAFADAYKLNRVAVASSGNTGGGDNTFQYPAGFGQGIIAVGATDHDDDIAEFSTHHNYVDVSAPGVDILSCIIGGGFDIYSGTSMATPHVSGIASLLKGYNTALYNDDIEQIIRISAEDKGTTGWDEYYGTGRVNAYKALKLISSPNEIVRLGTYTGGTVASVSNATTAHLYGVPGISDGVYSVTRYEVVRDIQFPQYMSPPSVSGMSFNLPQAWGNGTATTPSVSGLPYYNGNCAACCNPDVDIFGLPHTEVVPGTVTNTGAQLRTYVYRVRTLYYISGVCVPYTDLGYFPTSPSNVQFAATVVGRSGIQKSNQLMEIAIPKVFSFEQNYPNPFNPSTTISYSLPADGHVQIKVYDLLGREIAELFNGPETAGYHNIVFDAGNLSSGTYIVNMNVNSSDGKTFNRSRKILLMK